MRHILAVFGILILVTLSAAAQTTPKNSLLSALPFETPFSALPAETTSSPIESPSTNSIFATSSSSAAGVMTAGETSVSATSSNPTASSNSAATLDPTPEPQYVQGVYQQYSWQAYLGYTFFRFYESSHPTVRENQNGANWSIVYYWKDWFGIDGEMSATYGTQNGQDSWFLFGGGGPRFRWQGPRGIELWAHALIGASHFTPQTPFGKQEALAYEVGGGIDLHTHIERLGLRFGADMIGSRYFSTHQYSPKVSAGLVFKF
jgi:hypothetical protein